MSLIPQISGKAEELANVSQKYAVLGVPSAFDFYSLTCHNQNRDDLRSSSDSIWNQLPGEFSRSQMSVTAFSGHSTKCHSFAEPESQRQVENRLAASQLRYLTYQHNIVLMGPFAFTVTSSTMSIGSMSILVMISTVYCPDNKDRIQ